MRFFLHMLLFVLLLCSFPAKAQEAATDRHVILISIDGLRPEFYLEDSWPAPNLKKMARSGVHAKAVKPVFPSVTYPGHTTIITGSFPGKHGIFFNSRFNAHQPGKRYIDAEDIAIPTIWDAVGQANLTSATLFWPVSVNAPVDYCIPDIKASEGSGDNMEQLMAFSKPPGLIRELEENILGRFDKIFTERQYLARPDKIGDISAYLLERHQPHFMSVHFVSTDYWQHQQGRDGAMVYKSLAAVDRSVGKIIEAAKRAGILEKTSFIITGDHGFVDIHTVIHPNIWLAEAGLMARARFHISGSSASLFLLDKNKNTLQEVRQALENLPASRKKLFRILKPEELSEVGVNPEIALALSAQKGFNMGNATMGADIQPAPYKGTHGYYPDFHDIYTGFIAWGPRFKPNTVVPFMGLEDIAPIVSALLNLDFQAPDGVLYPGILD